MTDTSSDGGRNTDSSFDGLKTSSTDPKRYIESLESQLMLDSDVHDCTPCTMEISNVLQRMSICELEPFKGARISDGNVREFAALSRIIRDMNEDKLSEIAEIICAQLGFATMGQFKVGYDEGLSKIMSNTHSPPISLELAGTCIASFLSGPEQTNTQSLISFARLNETTSKTNAASKLHPKQTLRRANVPRLPNQGIIIGTNRDLMFQLLPQLLHVTRSDSKVQTLWAILPTALRFWDTLGLGPCSGTKDVQVYCIYDPTYATKSGVLHFLDTIGAAYENTKLGTHTLGPGLMRFEAGLLAWDSRSSSQSLREMFSNLGKYHKNSPYWVLLVISANSRRNCIVKTCVRQTRSSLHDQL